MLVGNTLKKLRGRRGYTISEVAQRIGISPSFISQVEQGKVQPSLQTLDLMLTMYSVSKADFFDQVEQAPYVFLKKNDAGMFTSEAERFSLTLLASKLTRNTLESFRASIAPAGMLTIASLPDQVQGERFIYVFSGSLAVTLFPPETIPVTEGDSLNFKCQIPCVLHNTSTEDASVFVTGVPPLLGGSHV